MTISRIEEHIVPGKRLGRHVDVRLRQLARPYAGPRKAIASVEWPRTIPILDQGDTGSCTGQAMTGALGTGPLFTALPPGTTLDEAEALKLYSAAEVIDGDGPFPPNDNGSTGPSVAHAAEDAGLISGYKHYTDLGSTLQALMDGPVCLGVSWYSSFDNPAPDGTVTITDGATVRGGHEVVARIVDAEAQVIGLDNSWGTSWAAGGSFRMSFATLERLLAENGDCTAPQPLAAPAPQPQPSPKGHGMFAALEAEFSKIWHKLDGEAKAAIEEALADAKADAEAAKASLSKFEPLIAEFKTEAETVIAGLEPVVKGQLLALLAKLASGAGVLLGKAPEEPPAAG